MNIDLCSVKCVVLFDGRVYIDTLKQGQDIGLGLALKWYVASSVSGIMFLKLWLAVLFCFVLINCAYIFFAMLNKIIPLLITVNELIFNSKRNYKK